MKSIPAPSALAPALLRLLRAHGVDATPLAARFGLPAGAEALDEVTVTKEALDELFAESAMVLGDPFLALRLPAELPLRGYGAAELVARASATLRDAALGLTRYAALVHPALSLTLEEADGEARLRQRAEMPPRRSARHAHEYGLAYVLDLARGAASTPLAANRVWFAHARPRDIGPLQTFFGTRDVSFGAEDSGFALDAAALDRPMHGRDPRMLATPRSVIASASLIWRCSAVHSSAGQESRPGRSGVI